MKVTEMLKKKGFVVTAEIDPPLEPSLGKITDDAKKLCGKVDALNISERKTLRMNSILTAAYLKERAKIETIFHLTCRDWTRRGAFGLLLSAWAMGLKNTLVVYGDSDETDNIYDFKSSFSLIKFVKSMNEGIYEKEKRIGHTDFCIGAGVNPCANQNDEMDKLLKSVDSGVSFIQTQPVYYPDRFIGFLDKVNEQGLKLPILAGIMPLKSEKSSAFLEAKLGVPVREDIKKRMKGKDQSEGMAIASEIIEELREEADGIHIYPMGNVNAISSLASLAKKMPVEN